MHGASAPSRLARKSRISKSATARAKGEARGEGEHGAALLPAVVKLPLPSPTSTHHLGHPVGPCALCRDQIESEQVTSLEKKSAPAARSIGF